jgi:hypothetical protein
MVRNYADTVAPTRQCVAGVQKGQSYHFRRPFFGSFSGRTKKEQKIKRHGLQPSKGTDYKSAPATGNTFLI